MTSIVAVPILIVFGSAYPVVGDIVFSSGHHTWTDATPPHGEVWLENDTILDAVGGTIGQLGTLDDSVANIYASSITHGILPMHESAVNLYGGTCKYIYASENSKVNLYGGKWDYITAIHHSTVRLYAYGLTYDPTGGLYGDGSLQGYFLESGTEFDFSLRSPDTYSHIEIIPEPATLLLLVMGSVLLRNRT